MDVTGKWLAVFLIAAGAALLCWKLRGVLLTPVPRGRHLDLTLHLRVTGPAPELEATVDGLLWLLADGVLPGRIVLEDNGMDEDTRQIARRLARDNGKVTVWTRETDWS